MQLAKSERTLGTRMRKLGYDTGYIGKWHLDGGDHDQGGFVPKSRRHGFDWWAAHNVNHDYRRTVYYRDTPTPLYPTPRDRFEPEVQTDLALAFLGTTQQPFAVVSYGPPHPPGTAPIDDWSRFLPEGALDAVNPDTLRVGPNVGELGPEVRSHLHGYYASILAMEPALQRLMEGIDALHPNALVVFASDHGEMGGAHGHLKKGRPFEEGLRVPLGFGWPGVLQPDLAVDGLMSLVDVAPTILGLIGAEVPPEMHGQDRSNWLLGHATDHGHAVLAQCGQHGDWRMLRGRRFSWSQASAGTQRGRLYDLLEDPHQLHNLVEQEPETARELSLRLEARWARLLRH
jgi:arylsulfatase A-like enzyme